MTDDRKKRVLVVHGCGPKPAAQDLEHLWRAALTAGLERDSSKDVDQFESVGIQLLYYADRVESFIQPEFDPALDLENRRQCLKELTSLKKSKDFRRRGYDALPGKTAVHEFVMDAGATLGLGRFLVKKRLPELHAYLSGDDWGVEVRNELKALLHDYLSEDDDVMLIGHCLGSVIAYDALWSLAREDGLTNRVSSFVSLGSPLSDQGVRGRLLGAAQKGAERYPNNMLNWHNLSAEDDYVCHDKTVADDFKDMLKHRLVGDITDHTIYNLAVRYGRSNAHSSLGYLVHPRLTAILTDWLAR